MVWGGHMHLMMVFMTGDTFHPTRLLWKGISLLWPLFFLLSDKTLAAKTCSAVHVQVYLRSRSDNTQSSNIWCNHTVCSIWKKQKVLWDFAAARTCKFWVLLAKSVLALHPSFAVLILFLHYSCQYVRPCDGAHRGWGSYNFTDSHKPSQLVGTNEDLRTLQKKKVHS